MLQKGTEENMKLVKSIFCLLAAMLITFGFTAAAMAFHGGGVAHCDGCHTMHNFAGNPAREGVTATVSGALLKGPDASSVCLGCHQGSGSYHIFSTDGSALNAKGGDFGWMTKTFTWAGRGGTDDRADNHGHNINASDFGLGPDATLATAPGGSFPTTAMGCNSCHDPHGKVRDAAGNPAGAVVRSGSYDPDPADPPLGAGEILGNFRLLGDNGYQPRGALGPTFAADAPVASTNNDPETNTSHTDYGMGISQWCGNCHTDFVTGGGEHMHPADDELPSTMVSVYNNYVKTGDTSSASWPSGGPFEAFVPIQRETTDRTVLASNNTDGATATSTVMCLTCHRAHASAFPNAGRWAFDEEFPAEAHPLAGDGGVTGLEETNKYYGRDIAMEFGAYQRSFCNKCHLQD